MKICTIGFTKKAAETFFELLTNLRINQNFSPSSASLKLQRVLNESEAFIRVGLGRAWSKVEDEPKKHYLFITCVHSFPDYLEGKNYNDFRIPILAETESLHLL